MNMSSKQTETGLTAVWRHLAKVHPLVKCALYVQFLAVAIWGPLNSVILVDVVGFIFLALYSHKRDVELSPYFALIFCVLAVLIVVPGGTKDEIMYASLLSARILGVMLISSLLGAIISPIDIVSVSELLHLSDNIRMVVVVIASFLPLAKRSITSVIFAQRSRGLEIGLYSLLRPRTYSALVVPYIVSILRSALDKWVSINLRPLSGYKPTRTNIRTVEALALLASFALWLSVGL